MDLPSIVRRRLNDGGCRGLLSPAKGAGLVTNPRLKPKMRAFPARSPADRDFPYIGEITTEQGFSYEYRPAEFAKGVRRKIWLIKLRKLVGRKTRWRYSVGKLPRVTCGLGWRRTRPCGRYQRLDAFAQAPAALLRALVRGVGFVGDLAMRSPRSAIFPVTSLSCRWVSCHRLRNSSRSLRRSSARPAVTCSMRSKRSSMVMPSLV